MTRRPLLLPALLLPALLAAPARAQLAAAGASVKGPEGSIRATFSTKERVTFTQAVDAQGSSLSPIRFSFQVLNPEGSAVLTHTGNAAPGGAGRATTRVAGISIEGFYTRPGVYTLVAVASQDGSRVEQRANFRVIDPKITLHYPPRGMREIPDKPLVFRWAGSGASRYRISVDDDPSFFNKIFEGTTAGPEEQFAYPDNPSDPRRRLSGGQVYYWKVEGLDAAGNTIAKSGDPYDFSLKAEAVAADARDLSVTSLEAPFGVQGRRVPLVAKVRNHGGNAEANLSVRVSLAGLPAEGTPKTIAILAPQEERAIEAEADFPPGNRDAWAIACVDASDDNVTNNCKTLQVRRAEGAGKPRRRRPDEAWNMIRSKLRGRPAILEELRGYRVVEVEAEGFGPETLAALLEALEKGEAEIVRAEIR